MGAGGQQGVGVHSGAAELWTDGHNVFLYYHPDHPGASLVCEFGVEVKRAFEPAGEVYATETPAGEAAAPSTVGGKTG